MAELLPFFIFRIDKDDLTTLNIHENENRKPNEKKPSHGAHKHKYAPSVN